MLRLFCICSPPRHFCASTLVRQDGATLSCQVSAAEMRELDATLTLTSPVLGHGNSSRGVWSSSCSRESVPQGGGNQQSLLSIKGPAGLMGFFPERCLFCTNTQHAPPPASMTLPECYWIVFLWELSAHAHTAMPPPRCLQETLLLWICGSRRLMHS